MKKTLALSILFICFIATISYSQSITQRIEKFSNLTNAEITFNSSTETISFIKFPLNLAYKISGQNPTTKALNFIENSELFGNLKSTDFQIEKLETDQYSNKHVTLLQQVNGVPVFDGRIRFHFNSSEEISSINGKYSSQIKVNTTPTLNENAANSKALTAIFDQNLNSSGAPVFIQKNELVIFPKGIAKGTITSYHLAYHIEVRNNIDVREYLFIDAHNGEVIEQYTGMAHAIDRIVYEENTSTIAWQEGDALPGSLTIWQQNEAIASEHTYNFFNNAFGYVSYDGADAQMITINNNPNIDCPNANWNGFSANYCDGTASDDVIAHEWGHAYTEYTNNLIYAWQSGAINEAYSDIWGETIDLLNNYQDADEDQSLRNGCGTSDRWRMGEDATAFGGAIRDMWNPTCNGDPGKVSDSQYHCESTDSGGVHINSGVPNHAYVLLVDGGNSNGFNINSIGFTKAAHIFWRAQSIYLTQTSDFVDLANALESSAQDLIGINLEGLSTTNVPAGPSGDSITAADVQNVMNAILAVEMRTNPDTCNFQPILGASAVPCEASSTNPIFREDWETGTDGWTFEQIPTNPTTWESRDWTISSNLPKNRAGKGIFGTDPINGNCGSDLENGIIRLESPLISIPNYATGITELFFNHYVATEPTWDGGNVKYQLDGGTWEVIPASAFTTNPYNDSLRTAFQGNDNPMQSEEAFTGTDEGANKGSWGISVVDLSQIGVAANSTLKLRFEVGTDGCNGRDGWYVDEIAVYNCDFALSVKDFNNLSEVISIYPNPSNGDFNLKKTSQVNLEKASIYDINGRLIKIINLRGMNTEMQFNINNATSGLYFVEVNSENGKYTFKVFKN